MYSIKTISYCHMQRVNERFVYTIIEHDDVLYLTSVLMLNRARSHCEERYWL